MIIQIHDCFKNDDSAVKIHREMGGGEQVKGSLVYELNIFVKWPVQAVMA